MVKLKIKDFISKSNKIHKNKFTYEKFIYINSKIKGIITCPVHGDFEQTPSGHIHGYGCSKCGLSKRSDNQRNTREDLIKKFKKTHGNRYSYDKFNYINTNTKGIITCYIHGDFEQTAKTHMNGSGCPKCSSEKIAKSLSLNKEEFEKKANIIHGNRYLYHKFNYINMLTKGMITCHLHGDFEQLPCNHLTGSGCPKCGILKRSTTLSLDNSTFTEKAFKIHHDRYSYEKVVYINNKTKVIITCDIHGDFEQKPGDHLSGKGCPRCKRYKGEKIIEEILLRNNIKFYTEYSIPGCDKKYRYDFFLPEYNVLIEFHGLQHYQFVEYFHKDTNGFFWQKTRDLAKEELAKIMKYKLIVLHYKLLKSGKLEKYLSQQLYTKVKVKLDIF